MDARLALLNSQFEAEIRLVFQSVGFSAMLSLSKHLLPMDLLPQAQDNSAQQKDCSEKLQKQIRVFRETGVADGRFKI